LGKSIGLRYVSLGAKLVICGRRKDVLEATAQEFKDNLGAIIETHVCDVRDAQAVEAMMDAIWQKGPLDVLLNNAAGNFLARTERLSTRAFDAIVDIVLKVQPTARWMSVAAGSHQATKARCCKS
jgi:NADP-dependent 3-hydroxy acid dehydrogenase YdfG